MMTLITLLVLAGLAPPEYTAGKQLPRIDVVDDSGRVRPITAWKGVPTILVPMYTRCPAACPMITDGLKRAVARSKAQPASYRVVLFSFDPRDTPADLRGFRERHRVPLAWTMATAGPADVRRLMESIDFRYSDPSQVMTHPNLAVALTPDLKTAKYLFGTSFDGGGVDEALAVARGGGDWIGRFGTYGLAILLLICTLAAVYLVVVLGG